MPKKILKRHFDSTTRAFPALYPRLLMADSRRSDVTLSEAKRTTASRRSRLTSTCCTPSMLLRVLLTRAAQDTHDIPSNGMLMVFSCGALEVCASTPTTGPE